MAAMIARGSALVVAAGVALPGARATIGLESESALAALRGMTSKPGRLGT